MGSPTNIYVDPAIAADSGTGTIGDPYGDTQYALDSVTRDATNGNQFNIKAGTDEILAAALSLTTYGTPGVTSPLIFRGYTSAANDGGIGGISGNGSVSIFNSSTLDFIHFVDLHCHNVGANVIIRVDTNCTFVNCEFDNCTGANALQTGAPFFMYRCKVHNCSAIGLNPGGQSVIVGNFFKNGANDFTRAISAANNSASIIDNIFSLDGASIGIVCDGSTITVKNNSFYSNGGTGKAIAVTTSARHYHTFLNNVIVGFSGTGAIGVHLVSGSTILFYGHNKFYNNATNETLAGDTYINLGNNSVLSSSPFTNAAGDDFSVDTQLKAGAYSSSFRGASTNNYLDVGAAQRQEAASGGGVLLGSMRGGFTN